MLIKSVVAKTKGRRRRGDVVPFTPHELLGKAIEYAVGKQDMKEYVYWVQPRSIQEKPNAFHSAVVGKEGEWTASSKGHVKLGKTCIKTDKFYEPKLYTYAVDYRSHKDHIGLPDIEIDRFEMNLVVPKMAAAPNAPVSPTAPVVNATVAISAEPVVSKTLSGSKIASDEESGPFDDSL